jgi:hypothetical protein
MYKLATTSQEIIACRLFLYEKAVRELWPCLLVRLEVRYGGNTARPRRRCHTQRVPSLRRAACTVVKAETGELLRASGNTTRSGLVTATQLLLCIAMNDRGGSCGRQTGDAGSLRLSYRPPVVCLCIAMKRAERAQYIVRMMYRKST